MFIYPRIIIYNVCSQCSPWLHMHDLSCALHWSLKATMYCSMLCNVFKWKARLTKYCISKQAVGGQPPRYDPPLSSPPRGRRSALPRRADGNVAAVSHGQHVLTPTVAAAWRANTAVSKAVRWPWPLILKVVSESHVTWATSKPILVFLGLSILELGPMYATDRPQTSNKSIA